MMNKFNRGGSKGGFKGKKFGAQKPWERNVGGGDRGFSNGPRPQLHKATCAECGNACEVPFKPTGERPIYCRDCFKKDGDMPQRGGDRFESPRPSFNDRPAFGDKQMFRATCAKCGDSCEVPFKPSGLKPVYCRPCMAESYSSANANTRTSGVASGGSDQLMGQFKTINEKLDAILKLLKSAAPTAAEAPDAFKFTPVVKEAKPAAEALAPEKKPATKKKVVAKKKK